MQKTAILLKPQCLLKGEVGTVLSILEQHGVIIVDCTCLNLMTEDVYEYFELLVKYPSAQEVGTFLGGMAMIVALEHERVFLLLKQLKLEEQFMIHCITDATASGSVFRFWFGG